MKRKGGIVAQTPSAGQPATKEELERRMEAARASISETVGEIRETVDDQYALVKASVGEVLEWRDGVLRDPLLWSIGALSAGFALGYTLGSNERGRRRPGKNASPLAVFADTLTQELKKASGLLPLASFEPQVRALFGFELSDLLTEIGRKKTPPRRRAPKQKRHARRRAK